MSFFPFQNLGIGGDRKTQKDAQKLFAPIKLFFSPKKEKTFPPFRSLPRELELFHPQAHIMEKGKLGTLSENVERSKPGISQLLRNQLQGGPLRAMAVKWSYEAPMYGPK